ncbi:hypothetical protein [Streptosporangium sp. G12]
MVLAVPLLLLGSAPAVSAESASRSAGWTCSGEVCLRHVEQGVAALFDNCSLDTCIEVFGSAVRWSATAYGEGGWYGHVDLWGPGHPRHSGPNGRNPTVTGTGKGVGSVCAQGWESLGGGRYASKGLPCVWVD